MTNLPALRRDSSRRVVGGVCSGLARSFNIDPILVRAALVVAGVVSFGAALLVYLMLWVIMPSDRVARPRAWSPGRTFVVLLAAVLLLGIFLPDRSGTIGLLILLGVAITWFIIRKLDQRQRRTVALAEQPQWRQPPMPGYSGAPQPYAVAAAPYGARPLPWPAAPAPVRPRRSSAWRWLLGGTVLGWVALGVLGLMGVHMSFIAFPATVLAAAGLALVVTARPRRDGTPTSRPTAVIAIGLVAALTTVSLLLSEGPTPSTASSLRYTSTTDMPRTVDLGIGSHTVDLSELTLDHDTRLTINEDAGSLKVILPRASNVNASYAVDMGTITFGGDAQRTSGMDISLSETLDGRGQGPTLTLNVRLDMGELVIQR